MTDFVKILKRVGNVLVGMLMIVLSLCLQAFFFFFATMAVIAGLDALGLAPRSKSGEWVIFFLLLAIFNAIACWEYFRQRRANVQLGSTATAIFYVPRGIDLIITGSERVNRSTQISS